MKKPLLRIGKRLFLILDKLFSFFQRIEFTDIKQSKIILNMPIDGFFVADFKIEVNNAEFISPFVEIFEKTWIHIMNACESKFVI